MVLQLTDGTYPVIGEYSRTHQVDSFRTEEPIPLGYCYSMPIPALSMRGLILRLGLLMMCLLLESALPNCNLCL